MTNSSRHHYIPQFFIENFTDDDGFLYIYDKSLDRIGRKKRSPKSVFFEFDRNSVDFNGTSLDYLEKLYAELDSNMSQALKNVLRTKVLIPEDLTSLAVLANLLKWRVPISDKRFNDLKNDLSQKDLSIEISIKNKDEKIDESALRQIENSEIFKETKRVLLGILPFISGQKLISVYNSSFIYSNTVRPAIIGDCPVIEKENSEINNIEDFILPLSSEVTLIYKKGCKKQITNPIFFLQRDLAILDASQKYIGCKSLEHLENVVAAYNMTKAANKQHDIQKYLFDFII